MMVEEETEKSGAKEAIAIRGLHKKLGGRKVLRGVDLAVPEGTTTTVLGMSGCGKTTLLRHIIGLLKPDAGGVFVSGKDIGKASGSELEEIRKDFGMVFQSAALLGSLTVQQNVALPLIESGRWKASEIAEIVAEKLALVRLSDFGGTYPAELSGGMRKRAGMARAIVHNPRMILYDEPITGLDPVIANTINELIVDMREKLGVTSVIISHNIAGARMTSDILALLHGGIIVEHGPPEKFMQSENPLVRQFLEGRTAGPLLGTSSEHPQAPADA